MKAMSSDMVFLHRSTRNMAFLEALETLYIREIRTHLNTRDERRSRELTILL